MTRVPILRVAVDAPLYRCFDYEPPLDCVTSVLRPGVRVRVPFGNRQRIGILVGTVGHTDVPPQQLKQAYEVLDGEPLIDSELLEFIRWAAGYYHHPLGEVIAAALPAAMRRGRPTSRPRPAWRITNEGEAVDLDALSRRAPRQAQLLNMAREADGHLDADALTAFGGGGRRLVKQLVEKGWLASYETEDAGVSEAPTTARPGPTLTEHQRAAVDSILGSSQCFSTWLLNGITGSGKTEVYLRVIDHVVKQGRQALVLVPEIGLTPQLLDRFRSRFDAPVAVLHSGLTERERVEGWLAARKGRASIVIGTRSAVFAPLEIPGIIVVDEEHDPSFKQHQGFRYSARDLAIVRGQRHGIPVVLGSATPCLETLQNVAAGRYGELILPERPGSAQPPSIRLIDVRGQTLRDGLSSALLDAIGRHLEARGQVMLYLNRRGYAPVLFCPACEWLAECARCDARLTLHRQANRLKCHHCGHERRIPDACPTCNRPLKPVGQGTERVVEALTGYFPDVAMARLDRDAMRRRGRLEALLADFQAGTTRILVGTQMLTKGHHFPEVTLVGVLNADQGLFSSDFRSSELLAQTIVQVAGRAGRADRKGEVLIQTEFADHPLLRQLVSGGYRGFATAALEERRAAHWPPFSRLAVLRAEASDRERPMRFLRGARLAAESCTTAGVTLLGPAPATMERRAGRHRAQLLLQSRERSDVQNLLASWLPLIENLDDARRVRWSVDVDPLELA